MGEKGKDNRPRQAMGETTAFIIVDCIERKQMDPLSIARMLNRTPSEIEAFTEALRASGIYEKIIAYKESIGLPTKPSVKPARVKLQKRIKPKINIEQHDGYNELQMKVRLRREMSKSIEDLNEHLFEALERLNNDERFNEDPGKEIKRAKAIADVSEKIISSGNLALEAAKFKSRMSGEVVRLPAFIEEEEDAT